MTAPQPLPTPEPLARPLAIDVLLSEQQMAADFAAALSRGWLDDRFFYWLPASISAWIELSGAEQQRTNLRSFEVLARSAPLLARLWPAADTLCALGCGDGGKERVLLDAFAEYSRRLFYVAGDSSQFLLEMALDSSASASACRGFKLDLLSNLHLARICEAAVASGRSCVYTLLGNTLGSFGPGDFLRRVRRLLRNEDRILVDGDLFAADDSLAAYDHPQNRRFAFAPLAALGVMEQDGDLLFELRPGSGGWYEIVKHFIPRRDLLLNVAGHKASLQAGKRLLLGSFIKYEPPALPDLLSRAGFRVEYSRASDDGRFLLLAAAPA